jgi:hypothetical protein
MYTFLESPICTSSFITVVVSPSFLYEEVLCSVAVHVDVWGVGGVQGVLVPSADVGQRSV